LIVISGVLAIVALALLIAGLASTGLTLVYISIAVSLVSAVFLGIGAYQRRGEEVATARPATEPAFSGGGDDEVTRVVAPTAAAAAPAAPAGSAVRYAEAASSNGETPSVLVVPGRPRYHVAGCRYLVGKETEERSVAEARNEGFTACGICRPDENLAPATAAAEEEPAELAIVGAGAGNVTDGAEAAGEPGDTEPAAPVGRSAATKKTAAKKTATKKTAATKTAASKTAAKKTTAKTAATKTAATKTAAKKTAAKTTTASTAKKAPAKKTSAAGKKTAASSATVVVIPDRDKFHTSDCRFVKGVRGTARLPKTEARQQGYAACGVCKP
jgi:ribonuclease E